VEGISNVDCEKIEWILKRKKGQNVKSDFEKWFEIWDLLFPNTARPAHPCKQEKTTLFT
jgi:hypothetical protein